MTPLSPGRHDGIAIIAAGSIAHGAPGSRFASVRFRGHVRRNGHGPTYWTTCTIVICEPGRDFAFTVGVSGKTVNTWRYQLEAAPDGVNY